MYSAISLPTGFTTRQEVSVMFAVLAKLFRNQDGATSIEYAVIASLVSVAAVTLIANIGSSVADTFQSVASSL
jgi:pilus assembly protein Flp/PilA